MSRRLVVLLVLGLAALGCPPAAAQSTQGQTFVVQPEADQPSEEVGRGFFQIALSPGETRSVRVAIQNTGIDQLTVLTDPVDAVELVDGGIDFLTRDKPRADVGTWLSIDTQRMTLSPGEVRRVVAAVQVPPDARPGDHVGGIAVENERVDNQGTGTNFLIDVHYRQVLAVVVSVPAQPQPGWSVEAVELARAESGSRARVVLHNTGNVLLKGTGTMDVSGSGGSTGPLPFSVSTVLPGSTARVPVELPRLTLAPGSYDVRIRIEADGGAPLATWQGSVPLKSDTGTSNATALPIALAPVEPPPSAAASDQSATASPVVGPSLPAAAWILAGLIILALGLALGILLSRRTAGGGSRIDSPG